MTVLTSDNVANSDQGFLMETIGSDSLLVVFGGISQGLGVPVFEFFKSLSAVNCDKAFFRDFNQAWYQMGVDNELNSLEKIEQRIKSLMTSGGYKRVCLLGNSMGGFASIYFGLKLEIDRVIAFAPQTFVDRWNRLLKLDFRWRKQIKKMHGNASSGTCFDLRALAMNNQEVPTWISVYYSVNHRLDRIHAERLKGIKNVELVPRPESGHGIVKDIRDQGELVPLIVSSLGK